MDNSHLHLCLLNRRRRGLYEGRAVVDNGMIITVFSYQNFEDLLRLAREIVNSLHYLDDRYTYSDRAPEIEMTLQSQLSTGYRRSSAVITLKRATSNHMFTSSLYSVR